MAVGVYSVTSLLEAIAGPPLNDFNVLFSTGLLDVVATDSADPTAPGDTLQLSISLGPFGPFLVDATYAGVPEQTQGTADNIVVGFPVPLGLRIAIGILTGGAVTLPANVFAVLGNDDNLDEPVIVVGDTITLCLVAGTMIRTPDGEVPIETLRIGDQVLTPDGPRAVVFLGETTRPSFELASTGKMPIRIRKDAFGPQLPERDTYCTPSHAFALKGCLIEAQAMVNGTSVSQMDDWDGNTITYYSLELDAHHLVWANGLLSESFIELNRATGSAHSIRASWTNWSDYQALHGEPKPMDEMVMPRIPFSRQLSPELRQMVGLTQQDEAFSLVG